jgi:hypothetical protein
MAENGYDSQAILDHVNAMEAIAVVTSKSNRKQQRTHDNELYQQRNRIERCSTHSILSLFFNWKCECAFFVARMASEILVQPDNYIDALTDVRRLLRAASYPSDRLAMTENDRYRA